MPGRAATPPSWGTPGALGSRGSRVPARLRRPRQPHKVPHSSLGPMGAAPTGPGRPESSERGPAGHGSRRAESEGRGREGAWMLPAARPGPAHPSRHRPRGGSGAAARPGSATPAAICSSIGGGTRPAPPRAAPSCQRPCLTPCRSPPRRPGAALPCWSVAAVLGTVGSPGLRRGSTGCARRHRGTSAGRALPPPPPARCPASPRWLTRPAP